MKPASLDSHELYTNNTWNPTLTVIAADGLPSCQLAGNVLRPYTKLTVSIRLPPNLSGSEAEEAVKSKMTPAPYDATVSVPSIVGKSGWMARPFSDWAKQAFALAS